MTTETVLTDAQCLAIGAFGQSPLKRLDHARAIEQAVLQSAEIQRLRADADRYRVLRDDDYQMLENDPCVSDDYFNTFFGEELDKTIDELKSRRDAAAE